MAYRGISTCVLSLCAAFTLSSCIVPGIQEAADNIGGQHVYQKCNAERPQDLVVYSLDGAYFVEMQLRFEPVPTRMFYFWGMFSISGGFEVGKPTEEERAGNPYQPYLVELSAQKVFQLLQRKVDTAPEDKLRRS